MARMAGMARLVCAASLALSAPALAHAPAASSTSASTSPAQDAVAPVAQDAASGQGKVVEGTVNPYTFTPKGSNTDDQVRTLLESMGTDAIEWFQHVQTLSNPYFEGRAPGSRGSELAHEYVEFWLKKAGLDPAFPAKEGDESWTSYRQPWLLPGTSIEVRSAKVDLGSGPLERGESFEVLGSSGGGDVNVPLAFAGYGIEERPAGKDADGNDAPRYTSFAEGADFTGRAVILLRYEPIGDDGKSLWSRARFSDQSPIAGKVAAVARRNPAAIILVNPPGAVDGRTGLESTDGSPFGRALKVPFIQLTQEQADTLLKSADPEGRSLEALRKAADSGALESFNLRDDRRISIAVDVAKTGTPASNVGGVVRGKGALANEWVIVGAHLDHVGYGRIGASPTNRGKLHPGADDNASGTAAMIILARRLNEWLRSDSSPDDARSILFMGFDAEESGLQGSKEYTRTPTLKLEQVQAMVNLDMVGRLRNEELSVSGVGSAEGFLDLIRPTIEASKLTVHADPSGRGPSDHASFYNAGVPVLFIFTGSHGDYHKPTDHGFTVNPVGAVRVIDLADALTRQLATESKKLVFKSTSRTGGSDRGYAPVRLGVQPGLTEEGQTGVKVESVSAGTSAADAGIQEGDVLLAWNGAVLEGVADMLDNLKNHKPGDVVTVKLRRGEETREVSVTLKASQQRPPQDRPQGG